MKRGEIYYIASLQNTCGSEIAKGRPAVIVSNDTLNSSSSVVEVVYLTTQPKAYMPTHVTTEATGRTSTVLCEQISSVSITRIEDYCGICTEEEMAAIDKALKSSLGLKANTEALMVSNNETWLREELTKVLAEVLAERDRYARTLDHLMGAER